MSRASPILASLLAAACLFGGGEPEGRVERVEEATVLALVERLGGFYAALENRSVDAIDTFEDAGLRSYFLSEREFADYYASLATQIRSAHFRHASPERVRVRHFRFADAQTALVSVTLQGRHERGLRFWELDLSRVDTWRLTTSGWVVSPDRL